MGKSSTKVASKGAKDTSVSKKPIKNKEKYEVKNPDKAAAKKEKKDKKKAKEPTPEPESDSGSASSDSSASESSDSEADVKKPVANGKAKTNGSAKAAKDNSDSDSESGSDSSSDEEAPAPKKTNGAVKAADSDESDNSSADDEPNAVLGSAPPVDAIDSDGSDSSSEEEEEKPAKVDDSKPPKRKAADTGDDAAPAKKARNDEQSGQSKNLFVGNLSWNVTEDWLKEVFSEHGEVSGARIMTDRATGRSKGFGYVDFATADEAATAHEAMKGYELDGRTLNVDFSNPKPDNSGAQNDRRKSYGDQLSEPSDTLFVGNLSFDVGSEQVTEAFQAFGTIMSVRLPTDRETGAPKGFGYVTFSSVEEAKGAVDGFSGGYIGSRPVRLDYSQPRPEREGGGGGFGGGRGGGRGGSRGGFGGRGRGGDRGRGGRGGGGRGGRGGFSTNRGGFGDFKGTKQTFD